MADNDWINIFLQRHTYRNLTLRFDENITMVCLSLIKTTLKRTFFKHY